MAPSAALGPAAVAGRAADWQAACRQAAMLPAGDDSAARAFFEGAFRAYALGDGGGSQGFFTGYYLPRVAGSRRRPARLWRAPLSQAPGPRRL